MSSHTTTYPTISPVIPCTLTACWNFTAGLQVDGVDVATTADVKDKSCQH